METLVGTASNRTSSGIRLRALIGVLYGAGLRLGEALALMPRDLDTPAESVRVRDGKGHRARTVGIDPHSTALLDRWLDRRPGLGLNGRHLIFATYDVRWVGRPLQPRYVRNALATLGRDAGIEKRVHPHGLRHTLATHMAEEGLPVHVIQTQLGHVNLATTAVYIDRIAPAVLLDTMRGRTWRQDAV